MKRLSISSGYRLLYLLTIIEMLAFLTDAALYGNEDVDTWSYYRAFDSLLSGRPDAGRTPLYPLFLGGLFALFGSASRVLVAVLQCALYFWSITWFRKLASAMFANSRLVFIITAAYALCPGILQFNCLIMTDAPSLAGMTALLWLSYKAYYRWSLRSAIGAGAVMIALIATRPVFIFLPFLFGLFWLIALSRKALRPVALASLGMGVVAVALMGWHTAEVRRTYGLQSPTMINCYNNYCLLREAGVIRLSKIENPRVASVMDSIFTLRPTAGSVADNWSEVAALKAALKYSEFDAWVNDELAAHVHPLADYLVYDRLVKVSGRPGVLSWFLHFPRLSYFITIFTPNFATFFLLIAAFCLYLIISDIHHRRLSAFKWLLAGIYISMAIVTILGADDAWARLMTPAYSSLLLIIAALFLPAARYILKK